MPILKATAERVLIHLPQMNELQTMFDVSHWDRLILCTKEAGQYQFVLEQCKSASKDVLVVQDPDKLPHLNDDYDWKQRTLFISDDTMIKSEMENRLHLYFIRGRLHGITTLFLANDYFILPLSIRRNCHYMIVRSGERLLHIQNEVSRLMWEEK